MVQRTVPSKNIALITYKSAQADHNSHHSNKQRAYISMHLTECKNRPDSLIKTLLGIWKSSVKSTHTFLEPSAIDTIYPYVECALQSMQHLICAIDEQENILGFMGVEKAKIEMLFLAPQSRGQGLGRRFTMYALKKLLAPYLDVNEQNDQAVGFYNHLGFNVFMRSPFDGMGKPYPLLHMKYENIFPIPAGYSIEPASIAHIPHLNAIDAAAATIFPEGSLPAHILQEQIPESFFIRARQKGMLWVSLYKGEVNGFLMGCEHKEGWLLAQLDVHPDHGRKGLGTALMQCAIENARYKEIPALFLTTFATVPWNAPFYARLGFLPLHGAEQPLWLQETLIHEQGKGLPDRIAMRLVL